MAVRKMGLAVRAALLLCMVAAVTCQLPDPTISADSGGLTFSLKDNGYRLVSYHYSVNKPVTGVGSAQHATDVNVKTGDSFVLQDSSVVLHPGDTVHYWMVAIRQADNVGLQITDRSWTYTGAVTTTTTRATAGTTSPPMVRPPLPTSAPSTTQAVHAVHINTGAPTTASPTASPTASQTGSGSGSNTGSGFVSGSGSGFVNTGASSTGGGGGGGLCNYGPGQGDGFIDDRTCTSFPCLIFQDDFNYLNHRVWEHEITASGGGNWEFQYYCNNRSNSYTRDGVLYMKPTLTSDQFGTEYLEHGTMDLWGGSAADRCTSNMDWGCKRQGQPGQVVNPIQSARLRSSRGFNFRYGKVEVEAKLPAGDWIWPAIWLLPRLNVYGLWPASGEIDIMESRGNRDYHDPQGKSLGVDSMGSTLHFGADFYTNKWPTAHKEVQLQGNTFADDFHKFGVEWDNTSITFTLDGQETLKVAPGPGGFWEYGGLDQDDKNYDNPWRGASRMAPFDQEFYLILNVAVGGTAFFADENRNTPSPKPWQDGAGHEADRFWGARNQWYPTWHPDTNNGEDAAMKVNYIKVWKTQPDH